MMSVAGDDVSWLDGNDISLDIAGMADAMKPDSLGLIGRWRVFLSFLFMQMSRCLGGITIIATAYSTSDESCMKELWLCW